MSWKLLTYSEILQPLPPYKNSYIVGIVEGQDGARKIVRINKAAASLIYIGIEGKINKEESPAGEIETFVPTEAVEEVVQKVVLITGSSSGIGRAIALEFAGKGFATVINSYQHLEEGDRVVKEIKNFNGRAIHIQADISDFKQVEEMIERIIKEFGQIDVLVNNAGIALDKRLVDMPHEDWDKVLSTNLTGTFNCAKEVLKLMIEHGSGKIINISSIIGEIGNVGQANYAASKGGVIAFTKSMAKECAPYGILVNAVAPGFIDTKMLKSIPKSTLNEVLSSIPAGRLGKPEEVAKLVYFLASDDANYITGQVFNINGGLFM